MCDLAESALKPGELMHLVADGLTEHGLSICYPQRGDSRRLVVKGMRDSVCCFLSVGDTGEVEWCCPVRDDRDADPRRVADAVAVLLRGHAGREGRPGPCAGAERMTFRGIVARELKARGLRAGLEVYTDDDVFDVVAVIAVDDPDDRCDSEAWVDDDGVIEWRRDYCQDFALVTWEPGARASVVDKAGIARDIVGKVTSALSAAALLPAALSADGGMVSDA
jgi:hypothetical protein